MAPQKKAPKEVEPIDLPTLTSLTMHQVKPGAWVVLEITSQGTKVIDQEVVTSGGVSRTEAENVLRVAVARRFLYG